MDQTPIVTSYDAFLEHRFSTGAGIQEIGERVDRRCGAVVW
jgi:hypothetical protein